MAESQPSAAPAPKKKRRLWLWILLIILGLGVLLSPVLIFLGIVGSMMGGRLPETGEGVAIIRVEGVIVSGRDGGGFGGGQTAGSETISDQIQRAADSSNVRAILVRINSPGGSPAASEEIFNQLLKAREEKPVIVSMGDVAASGGYYIAAAGDEIFCNAGTLTGSIGVITSHLDLSGLMKKVGANYEALTTGEFKDMGSPSRPLTARERQLLKDLIGDVYQQFVEAVAKGRKMPAEKVLKIADGRIFTGRQALKVGLVDELGGFQQALESAAKRGGIRGKPRRIEYGPRNLFDLLFGRTDYEMALNAAARNLLARQAAKELSDAMLR